MAGEIVILQPECAAAYKRKWQAAITQGDDCIIIWNSNSFIFRFQKKKVLFLIIIIITYYDFIMTLLWIIIIIFYLKIYY